MRRQFRRCEQELVAAGGVFFVSPIHREPYDMFHVLQVLAVLLVAVATCLALAHALELPGKLRLSKDTYLAIQPIYYPGFTIGGASEPLGMIVLLLLMIPRRSQPRVRALAARGSWSALPHLACYRRRNLGRAYSQIGLLHIQP